MLFPLRLRGGSRTGQGRGVAAAARRRFGVSCWRGRIPRRYEGRWLWNYRPAADDGSRPRAFGYVRRPAREYPAAGRGPSSWACGSRQGPPLRRRPARPHREGRALPVLRVRAAAEGDPGGLQPGVTEFRVESARARHRGRGAGAGGAGGGEADRPGGGQDEAGHRRATTRGSSPP
jgi:hypothetical protein